MLNILQNASCKKEMLFKSAKFNDKLKKCILLHFILSSD